MVPVAVMTLVAAGLSREVDELDLGVDGLRGPPLYNGMVGFG